MSNGLPTCEIETSEFKETRREGLSAARRAGRCASGVATHKPAVELGLHLRPIAGQRIRPNDKGILGAKEYMELSPDGENTTHNEVTHELIACVDGEELHALLHEQRACQLHRGHEAEPHMKAERQA
jgi:hypothetical protein